MDDAVVGQVWEELEPAGSVHRRIRITEIYQEYQALIDADVEWTKGTAIQGRGVGQIVRIRAGILHEDWRLT